MSKKNTVPKIVLGEGRIVHSLILNEDFSVTLQLWRYERSVADREGAHMRGVPNPKELVAEIVLAGSTGSTQNSISNWVHQAIQMRLRAIDNKETRDKCDAALKAMLNGGPG